MNLMRKNKLMMCLVLALLVETFSCSLFMEQVPFVLSKAECILESESGGFSLAGIRFFVWNLHDADISSMKAVFSVFRDESGGTALSCGTVLSVEMDCIIKPGEMETFEVCLDRFLLEVPDEPLYVDHCYLQEVVYSDGEKWYDPAGLYSIGSRGL